MADEDASGPADRAPQVLAVGLPGHDELTVAGLQEQVERTEQPDQPGGVWRFEQGVGVLVEDAPLLTGDRHLPGVLGPVLLDVLHRGVEVARHLLGRRRTQQPEHAADRVERRIDPLGWAAPARDAFQHRGRGPRLQLEPAAQGGEPERLLVDVLGPARLAPALVRRGETPVELPGEVALDGGTGDHRPHLVSDPVERVEHRDPGLLQRRGRVDHPLGGVGLGEWCCRRGDSGGLGAAVGVRSSPEGPGREQVGRVGREPTHLEGPERPVRSGVLDTQVEDRRVRGGRAAVPVELLGVHAVGEHLVTGDLHECCSSRGR